MDRQDLACVSRLWTYTEEEKFPSRTRCSIPSLTTLRGTRSEPVRKATDLQNRSIRAEDWYPVENLSSAAYVFLSPSSWAMHDISRRGERGVSSSSSAYVVGTGSLGGTGTVHGVQVRTILSIHLDIHLDPHEDKQVVRRV